MTIMGFVGLATEGGLWYLGRRNTQNAADAAAVAGALAAAYNANATTAALNSAASNGFPNTGNTSVTVNFTAATTTETAKVQVTVSQQMTPYISALFTPTPTTVGAIAAAQIKSTGSACVLSTSGDLTISGTSTSGCAFASNSTSSTAINVTGVSTLSLTTATSVGGCCGSGSFTTSGKPSSPYHPATSNPYVAADALAFPTFDASLCDTIPAPAVYNGSNNLFRGTNVILLVPYNPASPRAYCENLSVTTAAPVLVPSGTYFFNNASLLMNGGSISCEVTCTSSRPFGSTFIFTGSTGTIGSVDYGTGSCGASGSFSVIALKTNTNFSALNGVLFYGRGVANARICASNTGGRQPLGGGIYFPKSLLTFSGTTGVTACIVLVAETITLASSTNIASTSCRLLGTTLAQMQAVSFVQ